MRAPSGLNAAELTALLWPLSSATSRPLAASQTRAVLSTDAVTTRAPSGLKAADSTRPPWPLSSAISRPLAASHTRAV